MIRFFSTLVAVVLFKAPAFAQMALTPATATVAPAVTPFPSFGEHGYELMGVRGACASIAVRLPGLPETAPCVRTSGVLLHEEFLLDLAEDGKYVVEVREVPQTTAEREASRAAFPGSAWQVSTSGPNVHAMRQQNGFLLTLADGNKLLVEAIFMQVGHYDESNALRGREREQRLRMEARLAEMAARTLRVLRPFGSASLVRLPMLRGGSVELTLPPGVYVRRVLMVTNELEIGAELSPCTTYGFFAPPEQEWSQVFDRVLVARSCPAEGQDSSPPFAIEERNLPAPLVGVRAALQARLQPRVDTTEASATPAARRPGCTTTVADPDPPMNVRTDASASSAVVGTLENGVAVQVVERRGRWLRIEGAVPGWAYSTNLREVCL